MGMPIANGYANCEWVCQLLIWVLQERYRVLAQPKSTYYGAADRYLP